jgi:BirA family biotin operon repressor/biotin-[acetyl-CoA-carboxylase] ligase
MEESSHIKEESPYLRRQILKILKQEGSISGEELGRRLGISRTAIWKHINGLRELGYRFTSSPRKGYTLLSSPDLLLPEEIQGGLETKRFGKRIIFHHNTSSTQDVARRHAESGTPEGTVVVAESQSAGRGRLGRSWHSPPGAGIYLSIVLRPGIIPRDDMKIPLVASVAAVNAIKRITSLDVRIKWPNDLIVNNKKTGGILVESTSEIDIINFMILGMGINVNTPDSMIPRELQDIATSLYIESKKKISRVKLFQSLMMELETSYDTFLKEGFETLRRKWISFSNTIGSKVLINSPGEPPFEGTAIDIDMEGALIVKLSDGTEKRVLSGDVSLRHI